MIQMSLFDFVEENSTDSCSVLGQINEEQEDANDYLQKGEKILTLLRNKKHKEFIPSGLFESVNIRSFTALKDVNDKLDCLKKTAKKILKQKWIKACDAGEYETFFNDIGMKNAKVVKQESYQTGSRILQSLCKKEFSGAVTIVIDEHEYCAPIGRASLSERKSGRVYWLRGMSSDMYTVIDTSHFFWEEYLMNCLRDRVRIEIEGLADELLIDNVIADFIDNEIQNVLARHLNQYHMVKVSKEALAIPFIRQYFQVRNIPVCEEKLSSVRVSEMLPVWLLSQERYMKGAFYYYGTFIIKLFEMLNEVYSDDKLSDIFLKRVAEDYAKVYQTKKAIPDKMIKAMSKSGFNDFFGYVEFDSECDLKSIAEIEKEFRALQSHIFHQRDNKQDVSLRFRKLGQHKASGLYFPRLKCLCVDVRSPSSMAHEYGHMLDYENSSISKGVKFSPVRARYKELLETFICKLPKDDPLRQRWEGHTKYNKDYYLEPTEIFARCLEMYLVRVLEIDNSLVKPNVGFDYPEDERLMELIKCFYDEFFNGVQVAKAAAAGK